MTKPIISLILTLVLYLPSYAQQSGLIYYLKNNGTLVSAKDSADYSMVVFPPDTSADKNLYLVREYYKDGKLKLVTTSKTNDLNLKYQGAYVSYFSSGRKMRIGTFDNGEPAGHEIEYFPNGQLYNTKDYSTDKKVLLMTCKDQAGGTLAENGNGKWIEYDENFKDTTAQGDVLGGVMQGKWRGKINDSVSFENEYINGRLKSAAKRFKYQLPKDVIVKVDVFPQFVGGMEAFYKYLGRTMMYPVAARENNIQGKVIVSFIVEKDGSLSDFKMTRSIPALDAEALRVLKLSPRWSPGLVKNEPVRVFYSVPISFALAP
ncbi:TonB family protein [Mucilaginibacter flavidus]|uniref:TonB family protein n=1 Tax=Mucilaginibacter flavidus TaxID=2949309 RepID=UPI002093E881|nr:TonB family protein [Mucilaginibacter flavidus]MCO5947715.1 TonB family protein [Mucilaginibacter flavidus]